MLKSSALTSLTAYSIDDESEDENEIVKSVIEECRDDGVSRVTDSLETQGLVSQSASKKRKRSETSSADDLRLPLPPVLKTMFNSQSQAFEVQDDPAAHGGKIRSFAHVRGNWASFVYIKFDRCETLHRIIELLNHSIQSLDVQNKKEIHINEDLHLSLSKTQVFRHHWIDPFLQSIKLKLKAYKQFEVAFNGFEVYVNEEKTRTFLGLEVFATESLLNLVQDCDECLSEYDLEPYYDDPSFHVSLAWMVGNHENWMRNHLVPILTQKWSYLADSEKDLNYYNINCICFKTGNKNYELFL